uniref:Uncharacterized protein n=1 Tax=Entomoneis paludosa TaxID=265537 RepID=A0A7S2YJR9_9STRA
MALLCCFYFANFGQGEEEEDRQDRQLRNYNNYNNYNYNQQQQEQEEYEEGYASMLMSRHSFILFLMYGLVSVLFLGVTYRFLPPETANSTTTDSSKGLEGQSLDGEETDSLQTRTRMDVLYDVSKILSIFAVAMMTLTSIIALASPLFILQDEGERDRMNEEGYMYNFMLISVWMLLLVIVLSVLAYRTLSQHTKPTSRLEIGVLQGCLYVFPCAALMLSALYSGFSFQMISSLFSNAEGDRRRERGMEDGPMGGLLFSGCCFALAVIYALMASILSKYQSSVVSSNDIDNGTANTSSSYYKGMDDDGKVAEDPTSTELNSGPWRKNSPSEPPTTTGEAKV